ncbi:MAG TPA: amino acid adenylation domain-containing protein [Thermoanaerobaculia bacterium]|jgi:amino acid adenylation domain-containing protein
MSVADRISALTPEQRALFEALRARQQRKKVSRTHQPPPVPRRSGPAGAGDWPLSFDQERLWFMHELDPWNAAFNIDAASRIRGPLDVSLIPQALGEIVRRHAALRTTFLVVDGQPVQRVVPERRQELSVVDLTGLPPDRREPAAMDILYDDTRALFDLAAGPLMRTSLIRLDERDHICLLTLHHLVTDWISFQIFFHELAVLYEAFRAGRPSPLPELPAHYPDYAVWQREWLQGEVLADLVGHWLERLEGFPTVLELPTDRPRPPVLRMRGGRHMVATGRELADGLRSLARREGATSFIAILAVVAALLHRYSGQERMILGSNTANRNRPEIEPVIGYFLTQLAFGIDLAGDPTFRELLARVRRVALDAYAHQDLPFGKLVEALKPERDTSRPPLIQTLVLVLDGQYSRNEMAGVSFEPLSVYDGNARYDLMWGVYDHPKGIIGPLEYDADLFDAATVQRLLDLFYATMEAVTAEPDAPISDLAMLREPARHQALVEWNDTAAPAADWTAVRRFEETAVRTPDAPALAFAGGEVSYGELDRRANRLARRLRELGARRESRVAILLDRSPAMVEAILAVWKAGGAYVPLDTGSPGARLAALVEDAAPAVLIYEETLPPDLPCRSLDLAAEAGVLAALDGGPVEGSPRGEDPAYMIYTSGTTGLPKAVLVEHRSLAHTLAAVIGRFGFGPDDRMPHLARFSFDISLLELLAPVLAGGACELLRQEDVLEPAALLAAVERATRVHAVPSLMRQVAAAARERGREAFTGLRTIFTGGDLVPPDLLTELRETFPAAEVVVLYGPTEAAIVCTCYGVPPDGRPSRTLIGRPFANVEVRLMDRWGEVPLGVPGELCVGGPGVARGYHRREELTAERFFARDGRRYYRTGDLARQLADGNLEFLGRTDHQVKIRGFRVEPGEVEVQLAAHPAVRQAAVVALDDPRGGKRLAAYCVPERENGACTPAALRDFLADRLPPYMIPAAFVVLSELPLTAHRKLDRSRLPVPEESAPEPEEAAPPRTPAEELVAGVWCEVLRLPWVSRTANFFELGGHSLLATQAATRLGEALGVEVPVRTIFQAPTVAELALEVEAALAGGEGTVAPPIRPVPREGDLPLSFAQERLWFIDRLTPGLSAYNIFFALVVQGNLSVPALEAALTEVVRRHEVLRTTFAAWEGRPVQVIVPFAGWRLPLVDLASLPADARAAEARSLADAEASRPFDLEWDPVLRATLARLSPAEHALLLNVHHIAADGWSTGVLVSEIGALYRAASERAPSPLPELPVQYADFAVWQRDWLTGEVLERQLAYWRERLTDAPLLALPTDRPRPAVQTFRGAMLEIALGPERTRQLQVLARRCDATLFMVLLAAFQGLLGRMTGQDDVLVGSPIANRNRVEIEPLIGFFVNSLVLRGDLGRDPGSGELIARARRSALEAYSHQDLPFERLVEELRPERRLSHNPLFQVIFAVQNAPVGRIDLPGLSLAPVEFDFPSTRFDLEATFWETADGLVGHLLYSTDLFDPPTIRRLASRFEALLAGMLADPDRRLSDLPLVSEAERHQVLREWSDTAAPLPEAGIADLFAEQVAGRPEAVAVSSEEGDLTYAELDRRAGRLARRLASLGVGPEVVVALAAERSLAALVGLLGIVKAGGTYLPLDPSYPAERLAWMFADAGARVLLGSPDLVLEIPAGIQVLPLAADPAETGGPEPAPPPMDALLYVMYTSGSTGRPKGVAVTNRNVVRLVRESRFADLGPEQVFLQLAPISFDASTLEIWAPLANGGRLVLFPWRRVSLEDLGPALERWEITTLWLTAGLFHQMVDYRLDSLRSVRQLLAGGDILSPARVRRALEELPGTNLINGYGPTEMTTFTCCHPMASPEEVAAPVPLGRPIGNTRVHVLDGEMQPVPVGVWGELYAGGGGLSRGYFGRPGLTAERYVPDPFVGEPGARLYRTGDVVRVRADGRIEFAGRQDGQVKLRGFRVELGEIESALARHPEVREAVVAMREDDGDRRLVAYVVPRPPAVEGEPAELAAEHVSQWQALYDQTYSRGARGAEEDPTFNVQGWNCSYTGEPIPAGKMREWVDGTVDRLLALEHRRVFEVGCGTGLLLFRVAPHAERYRGTDFSAVALGHVRRELARPGRGLPQVELDQRLANDWSGISPGDFDLVVLNSVVQYFPGIEYLARVLENAVEAVAPGGAIFVGDVRNLALLESFHASVELFQAADSLPAAEVARRARRRTADEEELVVHPAFFHALARRLPRIRSVRVLLKRGRAANELTRFRYDVVLHVGDGPDAPALAPLPWSAVGSPGELERWLAGEESAALAVSGIPNARAGVEALLPGAVEPEDLWDLASRLGYEADLTWSAAAGADGRLDAVFRRAGSGVPATTPAPAADLARPWRELANDPLRGIRARRLMPELRRRLEAELPEYMVPSAFVLLDALPLTPNGKVDRRALPAPDQPSGPEEAYVPPATPLEELIAEVCAQVLGVGRVGMRDNFFALGGHSLLATQLVARLSQEHGLKVSLQMVFDTADLSELADRITEEELRGAGDAELAELLAEIEGTA